MKGIITVILFVFFPCMYLHAQGLLPPAYEITSDTALRQEIDSTYRQMLEDKKGQWEIDEVSSLPLANKFHYSNLKQPNADTLFNAYWFRYKLTNKMEREGILSLTASNETTDFYLMQKDGKWQHLASGYFSNWDKKDGLKAGNYVPVSLKPGEELLVYERIGAPTIGRQLGFDIALVNTDSVIRKQYVAAVENRSYRFSLNDIRSGFFIGFLFFTAFFNFFFFAVTKEKMFLYFTLYVFFSAIGNLNRIVNTIFFWGDSGLYNYIVYAKYSWSAQWICLFLFFRKAFNIPLHYRKWDKLLLLIFSLFGAISLIRIVADTLYLFKYDETLYTIFLSIEFVSMQAIFITLLLFSRKKDNVTRQVLIGGMPIIFLWAIVTQFSSNSFFASVNVFQAVKNWLDRYIEIMELVCIVWFILFFSWFLFMQYNMLKKESAQKTLDNERLAKEKEIERNELISKQKTELEKLVEERTADLKQSLIDIKATQSQLIQSEKMASLGELTAGIAHEIQNPLNFVNNFSEVSKELLNEMKEELATGNRQSANEIATDVIQNLEKILHHGKRADGIVKGMLQHSRTSSNQREPTDINALADEYLRLAYHGLKAKDKSFNATLKTEYDESIGSINIIPQDIGRVILNLITNAFYAVDEKKKQTETDYEPTVSVGTKKIDNKIEITVADNGNGIPSNIEDKIFQPFFTTKPTGQGTGLGLSLAYDIIKAHGGELFVESRGKVETEQGKTTMFTIILPYNKALHE